MSAEKRRPGRPPISPENRRGPVTCRFSEAELAGLEAAAKKAKRPLRTWIRDVALAAARRILR